MNVEVTAPARRRGPLAVLAAVALVALLCSGCSLFGGGKSGTKSESVFSVQPGQCFQAPGKVQAQLSSLQQIPCAQPHSREAYAIVRYDGAGSGGSGAPSAAASLTGSAYPGASALSSFAQGACAQRFTGYVGIDYLDSSMFFTYLLPSARSWEQQDDRQVICFVTTTGGSITGSVKGSKR